MQSRFLFIDDIKTWDAFRMGNHAAFAHIYQTNFQELYNYGRKFCNNDDLIGDSLQQLFTELWHKRRNLGSTDHIKNYLYKSFRRLLLRNLKKEQKNIPQETDVSFAYSLSYESQIIQEQLDIEQMQNLEYAMNALSDKQREVIYLKFYDGLSYAEISEITGFNASQVYDFMYKALRAIRRNVTKSKVKKSFSSSALSLFIICNIFFSCF